LVNVVVVERAGIPSTSTPTIAAAAAAAAADDAAASSARAVVGNAKPLQ